MRALKAVLQMAGGLKRSCRGKGAHGGDGVVPEDVVMLRALREANLPKLLTDVSGGWSRGVGGDSI